MTTTIKPSTRQAIRKALDCLLESGLNNIGWQGSTGGNPVVLRTPVLRRKYDPNNIVKLSRPKTQVIVNPLMSQTANRITGDNTVDLGDKKQTRNQNRFLGNGR
jgi:hypothetical protein